MVLKHHPDVYLVLAFSKPLNGHDDDHWAYLEVLDLGQFPPNTLKERF